MILVVGGTLRRRGSVGQEVAVSTNAMTKPMVAVRRDDLVPICPHCEAELPEIHVRKPKGSFGVGRGFVAFCPHCRKVLGFGVQWYPFPG
jgi:hypothetical protein